MTTPPPPTPGPAATARDSGVMAELPRLRAPTPVRFIVYAYGLTWLVAWPLLLSKAGVLHTPAPAWLHYLTGYGPLAAAAVVAWGEGSASGLRAWWRSVWRPVAPRFWALALLPVAIGLATWLVPGGTPPTSLGALGDIPFLPPLPAIVAPLLWFLTFGVGEEAGWRGILQPILQHLYGPLSGTLMLAFVWAGWHAPFFLYVPGFQTLGHGSLAAFVAVLVGGACLLAWLRNASGSVLPCIVAHAGFDLVTAPPAGQGRAAPVLGALIIMGGIAAVGLTRGRLGAPTVPGDPLPA